MEIFDFKDKLPEFGDLAYDKKSVTTKDPSCIFAKQQKSKGTVIFEVKCSCSEHDCQNRVSFFYHGLNHYFDSCFGKVSGEVSIQPYFQKEEGRANNTTFVPDEKNITGFINFLETAKEAIAFKQDLTKSIFAELRVNIKGFNYESELTLIVRREESGFNFCLFKISSLLSRVPLLKESKSYYECLGVVVIIPADTDIGEIKNDYANLANPFFKPVVEWVQLLGKENQIELQIQNIWVVPG